MTDCIAVHRDQTFPPTFSACVLLYGDNLPLAQRCLTPLLSLDRERVELRIGMNAVSEATLNWVTKLFNEESKQRRSVLLYRSTVNRGKYPMMRWMFHDPANLLHSPIIMWFDDDSYLLTPTKEWLDRLEEVMGKADMCGAIMRCNLAGNQHLWIQVQPWYGGKPIAREKSPSHSGSNGYYIPQFAVGGWWAIRTKVINRLDWPPSNIVHRGGDFMLGEALRQNDFKLVEFTDGVAINADESGHNHQAKRRGWDPLPVGIDYQPPLTVILHEATKEIEPRLLDYPGL